RGTNIVNLIEMQPEEKITSVIKVSKEHFEEENFLVMVTRKGIIKRTELSLYAKVRKGGLIAINLDEDDELAWVRQTSGNDELIVATKKGMAIRFNENDARPLSRSARGVKSITLSSEDDVIVGFVRVMADATLLTVTENGSGRRSSGPTTTILTL
ncbi:MAG: DNA gyrase C-terminal beta-propeller domain-containing protein, partial [Oscillospiraceae bacterium]